MELFESQKIETKSKPTEVNFQKNSEEVSNISKDLKNQLNEICNASFKKVEINKFKFKDKTKEIIEVELNDDKSFSKFLPKRVKSSHDISKIAKYIEETTVASLKTEGKDIVMLMGKTGTGKSTFIHFLQEIPIIKKEKKINIGDDLNENKKTVYYLEPEKLLEGFNVSHACASMTKIINTSEYEGVTYTDSPGLLDTTGYEFDIANAIGLKNALQHAKNVKIVLLIRLETLTEDRGSGMVSLIMEFLRYMPKIKKEDFKSILVCLTNISKFNNEGDEEKIKNEIKKKFK
jgi:hypothetical protein